MLTYQQAADELGVSEKTIKRAVASRQLTVIRLGHRTVRIREADLDKFLERKTRKAR